MVSKRLDTLTAGALIAVLVLASCSETPHEARPGDRWIGDRRTVGDTLVVTTEAGQVWPGEPRVVEELRIGVLDGPPEYQFGMVSCLTVDDEGGIYAFDGHVPALRYYSSTGEFLRTVGGQGAGPGEYEDTCLGLGIDSGGRLLMRDPRNGRINIYAPSGEPEDSWPVASGLFTDDALVIDDRDHLLLRILTGPIERNEPWPIGLLHLDETGTVVDTLLPPALPDETVGVGQFVPSKQWSYSPRGYFVVGISDHYSFELRPSEGQATRIIRETEPVPVQPAERAEWQAYFDWMIENRGDSFTLDEVTIPEVKPYFSGFLIADDGRIWVERYAAAEKLDDPPASPDDRPTISWRAPSVYDVFEPDGRFLGTVRMPLGSNVHFVRGDRMWGIHRGEFEEPYVVRWRLEFPEETEG